MNCKRISKLVDRQEKQFIQKRSLKMATKMVRVITDVLQNTADLTATCILWVVRRCNMQIWLKRRRKRRAHTVPLQGPRYAEVFTNKRGKTYNE